MNGLYDNPDFIRPIAMFLMRGNDKDIPHDQRRLHPSEIVSTVPFCNQGEFIKLMHMGFDLGLCTVSFKSRRNG